MHWVDKSSQGRTKISCTSPTNQTRKDASSSVPLESPFASVSTVRRGHPSLVSVGLSLTITTVKLSKDDGGFYSLSGSTPSAPPLSLATVAERILLNQGNQLEISWPRRRDSMEHPPTASYLSAKKIFSFLNNTNGVCLRQTLLS